jgi:choline dehydrogenase
MAVLAFKRIREIVQTRALQQVIIGKEAFPGEEYVSDTALRNLLKVAANTIYHASCTNAMGKSGDPLAVVDSAARVIGVKGLRVVDASIFPFLPPGHPQSLVCE